VSVLHGRSRRPLRSPIAGPVASRRRKRSHGFAEVVEAMVDYLRKIAPDELEGIVIIIQAMPDQPSDLPGVARFHVDKKTKTIRLFRIPIERLGHHHPGDRWFERMVIESAVIKAVAKLIGTDPWRLMPGREPWI
jgi:hypothetical protein